MTNVLDELQDALDYQGKTISDIEWATLSLDDGPSISPVSDYSEIEYVFEGMTYDNGYGLPKLYGIVVFKDGSWLERWEYDGSEGWSYKETPKRRDYE